MLSQIDYFQTQALYQNFILDRKYSIEPARHGIIPLQEKTMTYADGAFLACLFADAAGIDIKTIIQKNAWVFHDKDLKLEEFYKQPDIAVRCTLNDITETMFDKTNNQKCESFIQNLILRTGMEETETAEMVENVYNAVHVNAVQVNEPSYIQSIANVLALTDCTDTSKEICQARFEGVSEINNRFKNIKFEPNVLKSA